MVLCPGATGSDSGLKRPKNGATASIMPSD